MLNPFEKILFSASTLILSNRYMRNIFVLYAFALHFFVFATIWDTAGSASNVSDVPMPPQLAG